jgi:hypothetical protein
MSATSNVEVLSPKSSSAFFVVSTAGAKRSPCSSIIGFARLGSQVSGSFVAVVPSRQATKAATKIAVAGVAAADWTHRWRHRRPRRIARPRR